MVTSPAQADLIFEIRAIAPAVYEGKGEVSYNPQLILSILDPQTRTVLWTTSANVRALGIQKRRDRGFDKSMAVMVDKLAHVTGQSVTAEQAKAVEDNSRMPTTKVLLMVGAVEFVVFTAFVIHRVTHPATPSQPTLPPGFGTIP